MKRSAESEAVNLDQIGKFLIVLDTLDLLYRLLLLPRLRRPHFLLLDHALGQLHLLQLLGIAHFLVRSTPPVYFAAALGFAQGAASQLALATFGLVLSFGKGIGTFLSGG